MTPASLRAAPPLAVMAGTVAAIPPEYLADMAGIRNGAAYGPTILLEIADPPILEIVFVADALRPQLQRPQRPMKIYSDHRRNSQTSSSKEQEPIHKRRKGEE